MAEKKDKNHTTWRLFRNSSRVFFLGLTREFRLLVKDAINRSRKLHNSVAEPYSDFEVRISAKASLKKGLFKNYVDKRGWVENFVYSEKATKKLCSFGIDKQKVARIEFLIWLEPVRIYVH